MRAEEFAKQSPNLVLNQPPPLENYNLWDGDQPLRDAVAREGAAWVVDQAHSYGARLGTSELLKAGELANRYTPVLRTHDRYGHRIDEVEFHPAWHQLMQLSVENRGHSLPWVEKRERAHVARAALNMLRNQIEEGTGCPITMTFAVIPSLRIQPELAREWEPRVLSDEYDPRCIPADKKRGALFGMAMTERQGGSDVRANTTRARPLAKPGPGNEYELNGHKWFCSAPMCDAFLVLAQADAGLSCFLLPRFKPDGTRNAFHINRLKDKLGNRSNASSEVEFHGAWARLLGEEGRGVPNIIEMVRHTRLDCVIGSASSMRRAVSEALHHAANRFVFGKRLSDQPLMKNVLADLCLESEAATALALRLARSFDEADRSESEAKLSRIGTAVGKYWVTKRNPVLVAEALECLGGGGYVEESPLPRLFRDSPLNSIWEGSGNVQCLDVLRAVGKDPATLQALMGELESATGADRRYDSYLQRIKNQVSDFNDIELRARRLVEQLALALSASILLKGNAAVADAFCASRLDGDHGRAFGTLGTSTDFDAIIARSKPVLG